MGNQISNKVATLEILDDDEDPETATNINKDSFVVSGAHAAALSPGLRVGQRGRAGARS